VGDTIQGKAFGDPAELKKCTHKRHPLRSRKEPGLRRKQSGAVDRDTRAKSEEKKKKERRRAEKGGNRKRGKTGPSLEGQARPSEIYYDGQHSAAATGFG